MTLDASYFDEGATDADFDAKVSEALAAQQAKKAEVIATVPAALSGENSDAAQTALGSWAADAVKAQTGADAVLLSGVSLGAQIPAGEATRQTILDAFPGETGLIRTARYRRAAPRRCSSRRSRPILKRASAFCRYPG